MEGTCLAEGPLRWHLGRTWGDGPRVLWVLHSPSTADAGRDDPTLRRCVGFSRAWGAGGLDVVNLFAWRATRPRDVVTAAAAGYDVVDAARRDAWLVRLAPAAMRVVVGWGGLPRPSPEDRLVQGLLDELGVRVWCLGLTRAGDPRHPLYVPAAAAPAAWGPPAPGVL